MKTHPFTILVVLSIFLGYAIYIFCVYSQDYYFDTKFISDQISMAVGSAVGVLVLEQIFAKINADRNKRRKAN